MEKYLVLHGYNYDGTTDTSTVYNKLAMALAEQTDWNVSTSTGTIGSNLTKNNKSGFSALPGGFRDRNGYYYIGSNGYWWNTTSSNASNAYYRYVYNSYGSGLSRYSTYKGCGFSVRLIKD
jgi:uncharacterized protein (TIGR02145 family)